MELKNGNPAFLALDFVAINFKIFVFLQQTLVFLQQRILLTIVLGKRFSQLLRFVKLYFTSG